MPRPCPSPYQSGVSQGNGAVGGSQTPAAARARVRLISLRPQGEVVNGTGHNRALCAGAGKAQTGVGRRKAQATRVRQSTRQDHSRAAGKGTGRRSRRHDGGARGRSETGNHHAGRAGPPAAPAGAGLSALEVLLFPGDVEHFVAVPAAHGRRPLRERHALPTVGTDGVFRDPAGEPRGVLGRGNDRPALRWRADDVRSDGGRCVSGTRSRQLGQTAYSVIPPGNRAGFLGAGTTDQRCGGELMMSSSGRGTSTASPSTSTSASRGPSFFTWYHAPRPNGRSMSARRRAQ